MGLASFDAFRFNVEQVFLFLLVYIYTDTKVLLTVASRNTMQQPLEIVEA